MRDRGRVGGVDLARIVAAAVERPDLVVGHVRDQLEQLRVLAEEVLAHVGAVARLERLVLAVDGLLHAREQPPLGVAREQLVPARAPHDLDHVPARAAEHGLELLDDLAVAAHRPVEPLQVAVDDEDQVVELLAAGHRDRAQRLRLVGLAVAEEAPYLAALGVGDLATVEVLHEARLVDRHDRAEPHRDGRELPEVGHQPRVRIGGDAVAVEAAVLADLLPEAAQLVLAQAALEERARVEAGRAVALHEDEVTAVVLRRRVPEVVEADLVERRRRLVAGDVPAELGGLLVGLQHRRHRVPADQRADAPLDRLVARVLRLLVDGDRVDVGRRAAEWRRRADAAGLRDQPLEQEARAVGPVVAQDRVQRLQPVARLLGVDVGRRPAVRLSLGHALLSPVAPYPGVLSSTLSRRTPLARPPATPPRCPRRPSADRPARPARARRSPGRRG